MLSVTEARERILSHFQTTTLEQIPLPILVRRILAVDVKADGDYPPFDNSAMDGFALRSADTSASSLTLKVVADIPAGSAPTVSLQPGEAARIMTGAPLPSGADCVIPVEDTDFQNRHSGTPAPKTITLTKKMIPGENVRLRGTDMQMGELVIKTGRRLKPQDLGLLAHLGFAQTWSVYKKPRVALSLQVMNCLQWMHRLSQARSAIQIRIHWQHAIESAGGEVIRLGVAKDTRESWNCFFKKPHRKCGFHPLICGVSVGAFDLCKEVIEANGSLDFWR
jgi:molybdopterin molybdotransferase